MSIIRRGVPEPNRIERTGDDTPATSLFRYVVRMSGWRQAAVCGLAAVVAALSVAPLELQRLIVDEAVEAGDLSRLYALGAVYFAVIVALQLLKFLFRMYQGWLSESAIIATRSHLLRLYGDGPKKEAGEETGRAVSIVGAEVEKLGGFVGEGFSGACANAAMLLGVAIYMFVVEPAIALLSLLFLLPQIALTPLIQRRLNQLLEQRIQYMRDLGDDVSKVDEPDAKRGQDALRAIYRNRIKFFAVKFAMKAALNFLNALAPLSVLIYGGSLVYSGEASVGVVVAFLSGFERMSKPIRELIAFYRVAAQATVQHQLIAKWMLKRVEH